MISDLLNQYWMEVLAVLSAIIYLILAVKQNIKCWYAAIFSSGLYFFIMYSAGLYMESVLQIFYIAMAFYGWSQWRVSEDNSTKLLVRTWKVSNHVKAICSIIILAILSGYFLKKYTNAALPFLDGITRRELIKIAKSKGVKVTERKIKPDEMRDFVGCFLTGTAAEVTPVSKISEYDFKVCDLITDLNKSYQSLVRKKTAA